MKETYFFYSIIKTDAVTWRSNIDYFIILKDIKQC